MARTRSGNTAVAPAPAPVAEAPPTSSRRRSAPAEAPPTQPQPTPVQTVSVAPALNLPKQAIQTPDDYDPFEGEATSGGGNFEKPPADSHPAVIIGIIDLGTQRETYAGETKELHKVALAFELVNAFDSAGDTFVVGMEYTLSWHDKAKLRLLAESMIGRKLDKGEKYNYRSLVGMPCLVTIIHKPGGEGKVYANISQVGPLPGAMRASMPKGQLDNFTYSWRPGLALPEGDDWDFLPHLFGVSIADLIEDSKEYRAVHGGPAGPARQAQPEDVAAEDDRDIPF